jgi:hypothetical protein
MTAARDRISIQIASSTVVLPIPDALALRFQRHFVAHNMQRLNEAVAGLNAASHNIRNANHRFINGLMVQV